MKTIALRIQVTPDGQVVTPALTDIAPGEYDAVLVLETLPTPSKQRPSQTLHVFQIDTWPAHMTLRREDEYGDDGR